MKLETTFELGQEIYRPGVANYRRTEKCPSCGGSRKLIATDALGNEVEAKCPNCNVHGQIFIPMRHPYVEKLTVGMVRFVVKAVDEAHNMSAGPMTTEEEVMCYQSGIGSGSVFKAEKVFASRDSAEQAARHMHEEQHGESWDDPVPSGVDQDLLRVESMRT